MEASRDVSVSTGIVAFSISSHSGDSVGPMTASSGIDAVSLSDSSSGSEILETLPSSLGGPGHDFLQTHPQPGRGVLLQQITVGKEVVESPTMVIRMEASAKADSAKVLEEEHRHLQYTDNGPGMRSHKPQMMGETILGLLMDQVMMDATKAAAMMTGEGDDVPHRQRNTAL